MGEYRNLPIQIEFEYEFACKIEEVWNYVADTDRLNRAAGLPAVQYRYEPQPVGGSKRIGQMRVAGLALKWVEHPYEWVRNEYFRVERTYLSGPLKELDVHFQMIPHATGFKMKVVFSFDPVNWFFGKIYEFQIRKKVSKGYEKAFLHIQNQLRKAEKNPSEMFPPSPDDRFVATESQVERIHQRLRDEGVPKALAEKMLHLILKGRQPELVRIRPFRLAHFWKMDKQEVLSGLLKGTKAGVFCLSWDLLCPSCRGAKGRTESLSEMSKEGHCDSCNVSFGAEFDQSVELSFTVSSSIRPITVGEFCVGGPQNTPHYLVQQRLGASSQRKIQYRLGQGSYFLRSFQSGVRYLIEVGEGKEYQALGQIKIDLSSSSKEKNDFKIRPGLLEVEIKNSHNREALVILERAEWVEDACTAAFVTSLQEFRDLFSSEVLRPGSEVAVKAIALMFTDLKSSTAMYRRIGDATAFAMVRDHFDILIDCVKRNEGGLVKTIGDAVMASFMRPEKAVQAAMSIHRGIEEHNAKIRNEKLKVKIGIHYGPCFVVNLNERLDYFGSSVNIAARTEGQCEGGDIVITSQMMKDPLVKEVVEKSGFPAVKMVKNLKGFDEQFELMRIQCVNPE